MTLPTETMEERFEKFIENESMIDIRIAREFLPFIRQELSLSQNRILEEVENKDTEFWFKIIEEISEQRAEDQMESYLINAGILRQYIIKLISKKDN